MKKNLIKIVVVIALMLSIMPLRAFAFALENIQLFGTDLPGLEQNKSRGFADCFKNMRDFLSAGAGVQDSEDFKDYWRDFFLWPAHFSDVAVLDTQINKARYGVMSSFLRCEVERQKPLIESFYRLEAERYYVRHYVDTSGGFVHILTASPGSRNTFADRMVAYFTIRKKNKNDHDKFSAYFDSFEIKYRNRAQLYTSYNNDPVFNKLAEKVKELQDTLKGFNEMGHEMNLLFNEAVVEPAQAVGNFATDFYNNPGSAMRSIVSAIADRFDACVEAGEGKACLSGQGNKPFENPFAEFTSSFKVNTNRSTFSQVMVSISSQNAARSDDLSEAEMRARFEVLYGQNGSGTKQMVQRMDDLIKIVGTESVPVLESTVKCAEDVRGRECK